MAHTSGARAGGAVSDGWLGTFLLLAVRGGEVCGRDLAARMREFGVHDGRPRELYLMLRRTEQEGLVLAHREDAGSVFAQRRYGISASGEAYLEFMHGALKQHAQEMALFFDAYEGYPPSPVGRFAAQGARR